MTARRTRDRQSSLWVTSQRAVVGSSLQRHETLNKCAESEEPGRQTEISRPNSPPAQRPELTRIRACCPYFSCRDMHHGGMPSELHGLIL